MVNNKKIARYLLHPRSIVRKVSTILVPKLSFINDESFIRIRLKLSAYHYLADFKKPVTFNDKLNWLKINYHNTLQTKLVDKYEVKQYVANCIGEKYVVPCYGVWERYEDIDFNQLPEQFVLKATNDSSGAFICKNKKTFDYSHARRKLEKSLKTNQFWPNREWAYKNVRPRIIADKFLDDHSGHELKDYKFWCFNGEPKVMYCTNKAFDTFENFYDMDFKPLDINHGFERHKPEFEKPAEFELMKELASKLSGNFPFVRIDFFDVDGKLYFGEITFFHGGGFDVFTPEEYDYTYGKKLVLPNLENPKL